MKLPVMKGDPGPSPDVVWRRFTDLVIDHALAAGVEVPAPVGRIVAGDNPVSRRLPGIAILSDDATADAVTGIVDACDSHGITRPRILSSSKTGEISIAGYRNRSGRLMRLRAAPPTPPAPSGLLVLPVRAAHVAYEASCAERFNDEPTAALLPRHLDDPQYDAAVAIRNRSVIGVAGLQTRGQAGLICDVWTRPVERRSGIATLLVGRVIDLAARAQLTDVYAAACDEPAAALLERVGFAAVLPFSLWLPL